MQYRFSPIKTKEKLIEAVKYVANQTSILSQKIIGKSFPIICALSKDQIMK